MTRIFVVRGLLELLFEPYRVEVRGRYFKVVSPSVTVLAAGTRRWDSCDPVVSEDRVTCYLVKVSDRFVSPGRVASCDDGPLLLFPRVR